MIQKYILIIFTFISIVLLVLNHMNYDDFELIVAQNETETGTFGGFPVTGSTTVKYSIDELHQRLIKPINREEWIEKIWSSNQNLESHENLEKITILCKY